MSSGGIDNRNLFRDITFTRGDMGGVDQSKESKIGDMGGRGVAINDSKGVNAPKLGVKGLNAPKKRVAVKGAKEGVQLKGGAKLAGVPDRAGMVRFAGRPKDDSVFLGVTYRNSTGYKSILGLADDYHSKLDQPDSDYFGKSVGANDIETAMGRLTGLDKAASKYIAGWFHSRSSKMTELKKQITEDNKLLANLQNQLKEIPGGRLPKGMSIKVALEYAREGVPLDHAVQNFKHKVSPQDAGRHLRSREAQVLKNAGLGPDEGKLFKHLSIPINDKTVAGKLHDAQKGEAKKLGSGAFNTVYKIEYTCTNGSKFTGVFKKEVKSAKAVGWVGHRMGIDMTNPQLGCRNFSALKTAQLLGWNVVPHVEFGVHNGDLGIIMEMAPGHTKNEKVKTEITGQEARDLINLKKLADDSIFFGGMYRGQIEDVGKLRRGEIVFEDGKVFLKAPGKIDYTNKNVRRELIKLQWLDGINAQGDRHHGNYLVHVDDKGDAVVTGIDNDQAEGRKITDADQCKFKYDREHEGYRGCGWPPIADKSMYDAVMGLKEVDIRSEHEGLLSPREIDAKVDRMKNAQKHMLSLEVKKMIIPDDRWDGKTASNALRSENSYVGRDGRK